MQFGKLTINKGDRVRFIDVNSNREVVGAVESAFISSTPRKPDESLEDFVFVWVIPDDHPTTSRFLTRATRMEAA